MTTCSTERALLKQLGARATEIVRGDHFRSSGAASTTKLPSPTAASEARAIRGGSTLWLKHVCLQVFTRLRAIAYNCFFDFVYTIQPYSHQKSQHGTRDETDL